MYSFIHELNKYSVGRDQKQAHFQKMIYDSKLSYLKHINYDNINALINPLEFQARKLNDDKIEEAIDVTSVYSMSLEEEKDAIIKRADNINYLRDMNTNFELCRNLCKVPDSRMRNIQFLREEQRTCVTDCLNVRTEVFPIKKPNNNEKVFIWLA